jgi:hypothetical protein
MSSPPGRPATIAVMKNRLLLLLAVGGLAGVASLLVLSARPLPPPLQPGVTPNNFRRLHEDMSTGEVEAILGKPDKQFLMSGTLTRIWKGERCSIGITFCGDALSGECHTDDGQVLDLPPSHPPPSFWERHRGVLPW